MEEKELQIPEKSFDRTNQRRSLVISIVTHAAILCLFVFVTCSPTTEPEDLTLIEWGGSGGIPGLDAPIGKTPQGDPEGGDRNATADEANQQTDQQQNDQSESIREQPTESSSDEAISSSEQNGDRSESSESSSSESSDASSTEGTNESSTPQGAADGEGDQPAGGGGGKKIGAVGGGDIGRCWVRSPSAMVHAITSDHHGTVVLRFTVKPDGRVTNIGRVSGSSVLFRHAREMLSSTRACRADPGTPDVHSRITYAFRSQ